MTNQAPTGSVSTVQPESEGNMHTPEPWTSRFNEDKADTGANMEIVDKYGVVFAICLDDEGREEANANLMAAAPELLEALEGLVEDVEGMLTDNGGQHLEESADKARAAIQKARTNPTTRKESPFLAALRREAGGTARVSGLRR